MKQTNLDDDYELTLVINKHRILPDGKYLFAAFYCTNPQCDCNSGAFQMVELDSDGNETQNTIALMDYTWNEPISATNPDLGPQFLESELAKSGLEEFKKLLLNDSNTMNKIKKGYADTRDLKAKNSEFEQMNTPIKNSNKIGRNDPCYCGSGKKYKKCCLDT